MAFLIPRDPLTPRSADTDAAGRIDPATRVLRAAELLAWADADRLLAHARAQADAIISGTQAAFEAERQRGYDEGHEAALAEGSVVAVAEDYLLLEVLFAGGATPGEHAASLVVSGGGWYPVDPATDEEIGLLGRFDALGRHQFAHAMGNIEHAPDNGGVTRIIGQVGHEAAVES